LQAPSGRDGSIPLRHCFLNIERALHRLGDARELHQESVSGRLDETAAMLGDLRIDQLAAERAELHKRLIGLP
jgi:hypothetical protein